MLPTRYQQVNPDAYFQPLLIRSLFDSAMTSGTAQVIVDRDGRRHSYAAFGRRVHALALALRERGVAPGQIVAMLDWDSPRYLEAYFAVPMMGAVLQMVNPRLPAAHLAHVLGSTGWHTLLCHADFAPMLAALPPEAASRVMMLSEEPSADQYEPSLARNAGSYPFEDFSENAVATLFHTSGTTGVPKAVSFTHRQLVLQTLVAMGALGTQLDGQDLNCTDVYMPLTPMFHVHAWGLPYVATVMGLKQVYPGRYEPARIVAQKVREGVTFSHCVPTVLQMLLAEPGDADLSGWKMVIGGSALPPALHAAAGARGIPTFAGYGMSETGPLVSIARRVDGGEDATAELVSAGRPVPLVASRIVDPAGTPLAKDGVAQGELHLRSPWLTSGYAGDANASAALWQDGWLHTQDVASIGPDNRIVIHDRLKDLIKTGGEWVSSIAIEEALSEQPGVAQAAVIGVADEKWGERPIAFVVAQATVAIEPAALLDAIRAAAASGRISRYGVPDAIHLLSAMPLTGVGKIDKVALRALPLENAPR